MEPIIVTSPSLLKQIVREAIKEEQATTYKPEILGEKLTRREAAKFLGCSYQTMANYLSKGILKPRGHGRKQFYIKQDLIDFLNQTEK